MKKVRRPKRIQKVALTLPTGWLSNLIWALINLDEPALIQLDIKIADMIWGNGHTISWNLGQMEKAGNPVAKEICDLLALFLGPNHCINAQTVVSPDPEALTVREVTDDLLLLQEHLTQLIGEIAIKDPAIQDLELIVGLRRRILESGIQP